MYVSLKVNPIPHTDITYV